MKLEPLGVVEGKDEYIYSMNFEFYFQFLIEARVTTKQKENKIGWVNVKIRLVAK